MTVIKCGVIYKITYPNGKIYIGQDRTNDINYFGSAKGRIIAEDFTDEQRRDFTIRREILLTLRNKTIHDFIKAEQRFIRQYNSDDPTVGYNGKWGHIKPVRVEFVEVKNESNITNGYQGHGARGALSARRLHELSISARQRRHGILHAQDRHSKR